MKIIICGAGKVGSSIAKHLAANNNDVTVVDQSQQLIDNINEKLDINTITGSASNPSILKKAGADDADMIIAVTLQDEINMVACQMAHTFFKIPRNVASAFGFSIELREQLIKRTGILAIDVDLLKKIKGYAVIRGTKLRYLFSRARLLSAELIARESKHAKPLWSILLVQCLQL